MTHNVRSRKLVVGDDSRKHMSTWKGVNHYWETLTTLAKDLTCGHRMTHSVGSKKQVVGDASKKHLSTWKRNH
jgi:hypothetical protein